MKQIEVKSASVYTKHKQQHNVFNIVSEIILKKHLENNHTLNKN